ncbi:MAG TPA: FtsH protease activity modulator HflK [Gammaproteobacteria bacterium]|nr:FtsH protease activity modulator HflK [Gammaproteobacteria bacterium]
MQDITTMPMVWNEPGSGDKNQNPWGKRNGEPEGPPDLDQVFNDLKRRVRGLFGKGPTPPSTSNNLNVQKLILIAFGICIALYLSFGFYTVASYEQGVLTRFGKYERTVNSGLHWLPLFMDDVQRVNTENIKSSRNSGWMLTKDENIILVEMEVQYRVVDAEKYLFNVASPDAVLSQAADSAIRQVIGDSTTDDVLTNKKQQIAEAVKDQLVDILTLYDAGFHIETVNFRDARPPDDVKDAFDDVTKSREDRERLKHQAEAYTNTVLPEAEGAAQKILSEAEGYKERVILDAMGEAQRFNLILPGYLRAPQVTKTRMYMDAMEEVLSKTTKIIVSNSSGNNMIYIPLDKIMENNKVVTSVPNSNMEAR